MTDMQYTTLHRCWTAHRRRDAGHPDERSLFNSLNSRLLASGTRLDTKPDAVAGKASPTSITASLVSKSACVFTKECERDEPMGADYRWLNAPPTATICR